MYNVILDNRDNDNEMAVNLPLIPRIGDWIDIGHDTEAQVKFSEERFLTVSHVTIPIDGTPIVIWVTSEG